MRRRLGWTAGAVLCVATVAAAQGPARPPSQDQIDSAVARAIRYIHSRMGDDGVCRDEPKADDPRYGAKTGLCCLALLSAEVLPRDDAKLRAGLDWLLKAELTGVTPTAVRCLAMAAWKDNRAFRRLQTDARWLMRAMTDQGAYTHVSAGGKPAENWDNPNTYYAILGMHAAASRGVEVPQAYWKLVEQHWLGEQLPDGGWGYRTHMLGGKRHGSAYGSMTAAGIISLSICFDQLNRQQYIRCGAPSNYESLDHGLAWLSDSFTAAQNPKRGLEWYFRWLFNLQRIGQLTGRTSLAGRDWYAAGARELVRRQHTDDGSWDYGERVEQTCLAAIFLARGRAEVLLNKVRFTGKWNPRPRDADSLARWLTYEYEDPLRWQVLDLDAEGEWTTGRVLYVSGAGPIQLTDKQVARIRTFLDRGGLLLSEAACNSGDFTLDMTKLWARLAPGRTPRRVAADDMLYTLQKEPTGPEGLMVLSNGVRPIAIHSPQELSMALEIGPTEANKPIYRLLGNLYLVLTEMGSQPVAEALNWPAPTRATPRATIDVARIAHKGNDNPEPMAMRRLALHLSTQHALALNVSEPMAPAKLDAIRWPIAKMTGTKDFTLSDADKAALKAYVANGGTIVADAAGGSEAFDKAFRREVVPLFGEAVLLPLLSDIYGKSIYDIPSVRYRRLLAERIAPSRRTAPRLEAVYQGRRMVLVYSRDDLTAGQLGIPLLGLNGYSISDSRKLMVNILCHLAGVGKMEKE